MIRRIVFILLLIPTLASAQRIYTLNYDTVKVVNGVFKVTKQPTHVSGTQRLLTVDSLTGEYKWIRSTQVGSGGGSFIINGTSLQSSANFNISGNGTANQFLTQTVSGNQTQIRPTFVTVLTATSETDVLNTGFYNLSNGHGMSWIQDVSNGKATLSAEHLLMTEILNNSAIMLDSSKMVIKDPINLKGLQYAADYSANYTSRSIPDVAYVLAHAGGSYTAGYGLGLTGTQFRADSTLLATKLSLNPAIAAYGNTHYAQLNAANLFTNGFTNQYSSNASGSSYPNSIINNAGITNSLNSTTAVTLQSGVFGYIKNGFTGLLQMTPTANRTITFPDSSGRVALENRIIPNSNLANSAITLNGTSTSLGSSFTVTKSNTDTTSTGFATNAKLSTYLTKAQVVATYQPLVTLTTTGTSGAATFNQSTGALNIPQYTAGTGTVTSITPGVGFTSSTPITVSGTMNVDTATIATHTYTARYPLKSTTVAGFDLRSNVTLATLTIGNGLIGTSYNPSGATTMRADTSVLQTVLNFFPKGDTRYFRLPTLATKGVIYSNGTTLAANEPNFAWDNTNLRLSVRQDTSIEPLGVLRTTGNGTNYPVNAAIKGMTILNAAADDIALGGMGYVKNTGSNTLGAGHIIGQFGLAEDNLSNHHYMIGVEGRGNGISTGDANQYILGVLGYAHWQGTSFDPSLYSRINIGVASKAEIYASDGVTPLAEGLNIAFNAALIGGAVQYSLLGTAPVVINGPLGFQTGKTGTATGGIVLNGLTSGSATIKAQDIAGTSTLLTLPNTNATANQFMVQNAGNTALTWITGNGTGAPVLTTSPALVTPSLGVATATSINKVTFTAPTTSATLTLVQGSTLQTTGAFALNLTTTAATTPTFPAGTGTLQYAQVAGADVSGQTAANASIATFTTTASGVFRIGCYGKITAVATDILEFQVTYTDADGTAQTENFFPQGATTALLSTTGNYAFPTKDIQTNSGTAITVKTILTTGGGTIAYRAGATITKLR